MNNDIKEILTYMMQYVENKYEHDSEPMLNYKDIKCVLDYITNLQTIEQQYSVILSENAELENKITNLQEENEKLIERVQIGQNAFLSLNSKIDKAINKLKSMLPICIMPNNMLIHGIEKAKIIEETLNILEGE